MSSLASTTPIDSPIRMDEKQGASISENLSPRLFSTLAAPSTTGISATRPISVLQELAWDSKPQSTPS